MCNITRRLRFPHAFATLIIVAGCTSEPTRVGEGFQSLVVLPNPATVAIGSSLTLTVQAKRESGAVGLIPADMNVTWQTSNCDNLLR